MVIRESPFHARAASLNETGLWGHWSGYLAAEKYQMSEKFEYFAIRNAAGIFDTSPLFKYRITGPHAEKYLCGVLTRDIRTCRIGAAQYTIWCDDEGYVVEDGVILRTGLDEFLLTVANPSLSHLRRLVGALDVDMEDVSESIAALAVQGPMSWKLLAGEAPGIEGLDYFDVADLKLAGVPVTVSRTGFTGDLGYEIWVRAEDALAVWDAVMDAGRPMGGLPIGQQALLMTRVEAGLLLIDVDFRSARQCFTETEKSTPLELGLGWMLSDERRDFVGRDAIARAVADASSRWMITGIVVDWRSWDAVYAEAGHIPPKDHQPVTDDMMLYDDDGERIGWVSSFMYSPMVQRHIGIGRVKPELSKPGAMVNLEISIDHQYRTVRAQTTRMPFFNPERKTSRGPDL